MNYEASRDVLIHITTQQKHSPLLIEACFSSFIVQIKGRAVDVIQVLLDHWIYCTFQHYSTLKWWWHFGIWAVFEHSNMTNNQVVVCCMVAWLNIKITILCSMARFHLTWTKLRFCLKNTFAFRLMPMLNLIIYLFCYMKAILHWLAVLHISIATTIKAILHLFCYYYGLKKSLLNEKENNSGEGHKAKISMRKWKIQKAK